MSGNSDPLYHNCSYNPLQENFVLLIRELRQEFDKYGYLLTAAVAAGEDTMSTAYNVPEISKYNYNNGLTKSSCLGLSKISYSTAFLY